MQRLIRLVRSPPPIRLRTAPLTLYPIHVKAAEKLAVTVQSPLTIPVVYVLPVSPPPLLVTLLMTYPEFGVTGKVAVPPGFTVALAGVSFPPVPAVALAP